MDKTRVNERIRAREVRLIGAGGEHVSVVPIRQAMDDAQQASLDLVEISDKSDPPVCRIMDYGQFRYEKAKKQKDSRKKLKKIVVKEVKMRSRIGEHDYETKLKRAEGFLKHGDKVKFLIQFRGRENAHREIGFQIMNRVVADLEGVATVEAHPRQEGQFLNMVVVPDAAMLRRLQREQEQEEARQRKEEQGTEIQETAEAQDANEAPEPTAENIENNVVQEPTAEAQDANEAPEPTAENIENNVVQEPTVDAVKEDAGQGA